MGVTHSTEQSEAIAVEVQDEVELIVDSLLSSSGSLGPFGFPGLLGSPGPFGLSGLTGSLGLIPDPPPPLSPPPPGGQNGQIHDGP